jgi:hypothetical protein
LVWYKGGAGPGHVIVSSHSMPPSRSTIKRWSLSDRVRRNGIIVMSCSRCIKHGEVCIVSDKDTPLRRACSACLRSGMRSSCNAGVEPMRERKRVSSRKVSMLTCGSGDSGCVGGKVRETDSPG